MTNQQRAEEKYPDPEPSESKSFRLLLESVAIVSIQRQAYLSGLSDAGRFSIEDISKAWDAAQRYGMLKNNTIHPNKEQYLASLPVKDSWIRVEDRLPEEGGRYWCYVEEVNDLGISYYQWNYSYHEGEKRFYSAGDKVIAWQPLPTPPKQ